MRFRMRASARLQDTSQQNPPSTLTVVLIGLAGTGAGLYFMLVGLGIVPAPSKAHAPHWVVFAAGLAFALGGLGIVLPRIAGVTTGRAELPPTAPYWLQVAQYLLFVTILFCFAAIGTWIAIGPGPRTFGGNVPVGAIGGRIMFGIGALMIWLCLIPIVVSGARRLLGRG
jgi:hypothetical protein